MHDSVTDPELSPPASRHEELPLLLAYNSSPHITEAAIALWKDYQETRPLIEAREEHCPACPDCKGTGEYRGLGGHVEPCGTCGGSGVRP